MSEEPATDILDATYRALCKHGYADLTLQDVAAESDKSKASIHYHYECKDQLFDAVLDLLYDRYTDRIRSASGETASERLDSLLEAVLIDDSSVAQRDLDTALLEVKAQAPYDAAFRERLAEFDERLYEEIRDVVADGVDAGDFEETVDPELTAELLTAAITGGHTREAAVDRSPDRLYAAMTRYAENNLSADEQTEVVQ